MRDKLITEEKAIHNQTITRMNLMKSGGSEDDWDKLLHLQVNSICANWPNETTSLRWDTSDFLITSEKAWENMKEKRNRELGEKWGIS